MPIKPFKLLIVVSLLLSGGHVSHGQDAFRSGDGWDNEYDWYDLEYGTSAPAGLGRIWDFTNSNTGPQKYFRFYTDNYGGCHKEWGPSGAQPMTPGTPTFLVLGNIDSYFVNVSNTSWHYIFRTRNSTECTTPEAVYFEIQGDVREILSVSQTPTTVYHGQDVVIDITLSAASNLGQGYYLRYSSDGFTTSNIIELTGSGTSYSGSIPGTFNTPTSNISYYIFSSGEGLTIGHSNADFFTFNLNNNGNNNYGYTVSPTWLTANTGPWESASSWTANAVPATNQPILINHAITTGSDVSVSSLVVNSGGSLELGANNTLTLANFANLTIDGNFSSNSGSKLMIPEGGYLEGAGAIALYDLEIGEDGGSVDKNFYLNKSIEITHDLIIEDNGRLFPGGGQNVTLEMSGSDGDISIDGQIDCVPNFIERLALHISIGAHITFRPPEDLLISDIKLGDITIDSGASLSADAAGTTEVELQYGTLTCNGELNFGQTATGVVNITLRGAAGNDYYLNSSNPGQVLQFSDVLIGYDSGNSDGGNLKLANGSESIEMRVSGNFSNFYKFTPQNAPNSIDVVMNGFLVNQDIYGFKTQTFENKTTFTNLTINNDGGDVYLNSYMPVGNAVDNVSFVVTETLTLLKGRLITLQNAPDVRHNLVLGENADIVSTGAQSDEDGQPCYIEGPLVREVGEGTNKSLSFPVGQGDDYRNLLFETDEVTSDEVTSLVRITVEHFAYSANFTGMTVDDPLINISDARFWNIKVDQPTHLSNTQFTLDYGDAETDGITSESDLRVVWAEQDASVDGDDTNDEWLAIGTTGGASGSLTSGNFSFSSDVSQIDLTVGNVGVGVNPLPVTWLSISCKPFPNYNQINWSTASESNSSHFILQRSNDDFNFKDLEETGAQGWSTNRTDYTIIDANPAAGTNYYRLKQVDFDGSFSYSEIVSATNFGQTVAYPNPFKNKITLEGNYLLEGSTIELWSSTGVLLSKHVATKQRISISTEQLAMGIYFIRAVSQGGEPTSFKLVKN